MPMPMLTHNPIRPFRRPVVVSRTRNAEWVMLGWTWPVVLAVLVITGALTRPVQARAGASQQDAAATADEEGEAKYFDDRLPLIEREPYDEIQLDDFNDNVVIRILPLVNPPPRPLPSQGYLQFEAPDLSEHVLQVPYENVVSYKTYNELLIEEANQLIEQEEYGKAFRNLLYVYDHGGKKDRNIVKSILTCQYFDGVQNYKAGNFELAISIFQEIYERDPNFTVRGFRRKPVDVILDSLDKNIRDKFESRQYESAEAMLGAIGDRYGKPSLRLINKWRRLFQERSNELIEQARQAANDGRGKEAHLLAREANRVLPDRQEALDLYEQIIAQYPIVFVGVTNDSAGANPLRLDLWGGRRVGRLTMRSVVEFAGLSDEGGRYEFLNGAIKGEGDAGLVYRFTIDPEREKQGIPPISALALARKLVSMGTYGAPDYRTSFAKIVDTIEIEDEHNVVVRLRRPFVRPEALMQFPYDDSDIGGEPVQNGVYIQSSVNEQIAVYDRNPQYPVLPDHQHPQVIEWLFRNPSESVDALIGGDIDLIDRVPLGDLIRLQKNAAVTVRSYIVPTVHMLIPNIRNNFTKDKNFRNGLLRGINRDLILSDMICGGNDIDGCEVISGPFPIGTEENDQLAYGYNMKVRPEPFNSTLGMVLVFTVRQAMIDREIEKGNKAPQIEFPRLVLCHTHDDIPRIACTAIQRMWGELGIKVDLRELEPGQTVPPDDDWDFLYYEMSMQEPLTDADKLFGPEGLVKNLSAPVQQSVRTLGYADSWQLAGRTLRQMHRQIRNDVSVLPLWQLKEHYAFRENLHNIGANLIHLYQNIDNWRIVPRRRRDLEKP